MRLLGGQDVDFVANEAQVDRLVSPQELERLTVSYRAPSVELATCKGVRAVPP